MPATGAEIRKLSAEDVRSLAQTAQIALTDQEVASLEEELNAILTGVAHLSDLAELDIPATVRPFGLTNVTRKDEAKDVLTRDEALQNAPEAEEGMFKVSSILGGEQ